MGLGLGGGVVGTNLCLDSLVLQLCFVVVVVSMNLCLGLSPANVCDFLTLGISWNESLSSYFASHLSNIWFVVGMQLYLANLPGTAATLGLLLHRTFV